MTNDWWTFSRCKIRRVVDGDTVDVLADLGFTVFAEIRLRLFGIDAPECVGATKAAGLASADHLRQLIPCGSDVVVETLKGTDKYGRWLARITRDGVLCNAKMIEDGFAVPMVFS